MPSERKRVRAEAERRKIVGDYAAKEAFVIDHLNNKEAQYYSLDNVSINFRKTGYFNRQYLEGYIIFPNPMSKELRTNIQSELIHLINTRNVPLRKLIGYVLAKKSQDYWAVLYWYATMFTKQIKKSGAWLEDDMMMRDERNIPKEIVRAAENYRIHFARDLVQFVANEMPPRYLLSLFRDSRDITAKLDSSARPDYGIIYTADKEKFKLSKFSDAKKFGW